MERAPQNRDPSVVDGRRESLGSARAQITESRLSDIMDALRRSADGVWQSQRKSVRHSVLSPALVWLADDAEAKRAQIVDLSVSGLCLLFGESLTAGERLLLEISLDGVGLVQWRVEICWCEETDDGLHRVGAFFVDCE